MLSTPKVHFSLMTQEHCLFRGKHFYFQHNEFLDFKKATLQTYPALKHKKFTSLRVFKKYFKNMIKKLYQERSQVYKRIVQEYQNVRDQYNDQYFKTIADFLHIDFPQEHRTIQAEVGKTPICPRMLDSFSFCMHIRDPQISKNRKERICEVVAHECLHFLRFEKRKQLHPETPREEYDSPHLVWQYSEMVVDPVFQAINVCDLFQFNEEVKKHFRSSYDSFYEMKDGEEGVMDHLIGIFQENSTIEEKIEKWWQYVQKISK